MEYFLLVVEGAHDAALIGSILTARGFRKTELLRDVDHFWKALIPTKFPNNPQERLDHVMHFPDLYTNRAGKGRSVAISVAGGYSRVMDEFQTGLNGLRRVQDLAGLAIVADADTVQPAVRFAEICERVAAVNNEGVENHRDGFPLALPAAAGEITAARPRFGIYILPNNADPGTLENLLLECAASSYRPFFQPTIDFIDRIDAGHQNGPELAELRKPNGKLKAAANILGNLLVHPGCSLSVAISRGAWFDGLEGTERGIQAVIRFLENLIRDV
jgi:hypothetical protein